MPGVRFGERFGMRLVSQRSLLALLEEWRRREASRRNEDEGSLSAHLEEVFDIRLSLYGKETALAHFVSDTALHERLRKSIHDMYPFLHQREEHLFRPAQQGASVARRAKALGVGIAYREFEQKKEEHELRSKRPGHPGDRAVEDRQAYKYYMQADGNCEIFGQL